MLRRLGARHSAVPDSLSPTVYPPFLVVVSARRFPFRGIVVDSPLELIRLELSAPLLLLLVGYSLTQQVNKRRKLPLSPGTRCEQTFACGWLPLCLDVEILLYFFTLVQAEA